MFRLVTIALVLALAPLAAAGTPEAPELTDPAGDCAVPYGNEYLDIVAAWISGETVDTFEVNLQLATWTEPIAEGAGFTVQFSHQGLEWGIIVTYGALSFGGWSFATGRASAEEATDFAPAEGRFDAATLTITTTFPKNLFPHKDMNDRQLVGMKALSADLRPAIPFFVGAEAGAPVSGDGRWIACDEATASMPYVFTGGHGSDHAMHEAQLERAQEANATAEPQEEGPGVVAAAAPEGNDTPFPAIALVAALALAALARRR